jgi:hypothetical protein
MSLSFNIWAPLGRAAWDAGQDAISSGDFVFVYTYEDHAYADLKRYAAQEARRAVQAFAQQHAELKLTPAKQVRLVTLYIHAFIEGAFDQIFSEMPSV